MNPHRDAAGNALLTLILLMLMFAVAGWAGRIYNEDAAAGAAIAVSDSELTQLEAQARALCAPGSGRYGYIQLPDGVMVCTDTPLPRAPITVSRRPLP